ncbi:site-specific integrase [Acetivibrio ethanolgignens]|uniref:Recombinase XerD n=1 Tax=Acetivibrio ethanolgignens TaxID=290052 RepID=A0A0V8QJE5_9FIRM|nr:site-specific integrase [Acetivibrio ethanolgignens]KSV60358.1 recombinase XerD [Acetivibrio ethanolgignens]
MGKSINGKELGKGICQRKDGTYMARFMNRFSKRQTIYAKTLNEIRVKLREEQYKDEKEINVVTKDITLDKWYEIWMNTCKKGCRASTKESYATHYKRIKDDLGWRKLTSLNLIIMQNAINKLCSDNARKNSKKILVDMLEKAIDTDLITKNAAKQIITELTKEEKKERRVLTIDETKQFLKYAEGTFYYNLFVLALETGMRVGELCALSWKDVDLKSKKPHISVNHTLFYFSKNGKYVFEMHDTKTNNGKRTIPLTENAINVLKRQKIQKQELIFKGKMATKGYEDLVFVTRNNKPTQQFLIQECIGLIVKKIQKDNADFKHFTPHCFRHSFATRALENGVQIKTLSRLLGHGDIQLTYNTYCHVTEDTLVEEMKKMERCV